MFFGRKKKQPKWQPLVCRPQDVVDLMEQCMSINAPILYLHIAAQDGEHCLGLTSDYDPKRGPFDIVAFCDEEEYPDVAGFCANARIGGTRFMEMETVTVLSDEHAGDPRANILLGQREIKQ